MGTASRSRPKHLAQKLAQIRQRLGLSQTEMVRALGLSDLVRSNISTFETGKREPPLPVLLRYAKLVGVSTDLLIDDDEDLPDRFPKKPVL